MRTNFFSFWVGLLSLTTLVAADPTWPSNIDDLEEIMYQVFSFRGRRFADTVSPCSNEASGPGRQNAAEWLRTAFHDMATANTFFGTGGLDASIQFEIGNGDNKGPAFKNSHGSRIRWRAPETNPRTASRTMPTSSWVARVPRNSFRNW